ncbi:uncharacterized protein TNCV_1196641 [Trichonephila clavipes]|uniref:Uncharacterized protein n=1 Tax=Trichonephila clavipes TaxID=2585209 RepID=A0A8X6RZ77_TRICX|nr:uncharacterized protein TNCV_1196641 [Trichonephila clavipes]
MLELSSNNMETHLVTLQAKYYKLNYQTDREIFSQCFWDNYKSAPAVIGNCSTDHDSRCRSSVSRPQTVWLRVFPCPPSDQHMVITGPKTKPAFIGKHTRMSPSLTPQALQRAMAWSQWNTLHRVPSLELSLK